MTNLSAWSNHNICGSASTGSATAAHAGLAAERRSEAGYTLVALLAVMTVLATFAMAIAPSVQQQAQREKEKEAIFRGEEIADAIRLYYRYRTTVMQQRGDAALPSSMDQLLEGVPIQGGSKKLQILRPSAARDPLTIEGEWRFIRPRGEALIDFQQSVMFYAGNTIPQPRDPQMVQLQQLAVPPVVPITNIGAKPPQPSADAASEDSSGPFVGVASRSDRASVLTFYGIEQHNQWIFTPLFRN